MEIIILEYFLSSTKKKEKENQLVRYTFKKKNSQYKINVTKKDFFQPKQVYFWLSY